MQPGRAQRQREWAQQGVARVKRSHNDEPDKNIRQFRKAQTEQLAAKSAQTQRAIDRLDDDPVDAGDEQDQAGPEEVLGAVLRRRDRFVLATKYTLSRDVRDANAGGNHRKNLVLSLEQSLRRLRTDYVDVYQFHSGSDEQFETPGLWETLNEQKRLGKVRYLGISISSTR